MGSEARGVTKPHAVCIPFPAQSHIKAMLNLARLLHFNGFHITFLNTEANHRRIAKLNRGEDGNPLEDPSDFRFEAVPDGVPRSDDDPRSALEMIPVCESIGSNNLVSPVREVIAKLNSSCPASSASAGGGVPPVTAIVADGLMAFALGVGEEVGVPVALFFPVAACTLMGMLQCRALVERGLVPPKDESCLRDGYLDQTVDWLPGLTANLRLRDLPTYIRTADRDDDFLLRFMSQSAESAAKASAVILNTFESLENPVLSSLSSLLDPPVLAVGPLHLLADRILSHGQDEDRDRGCSLWREESDCLRWLDSKDPDSVLYVNFGSLVVLSPDQMAELAMGLALSGHQFLLSIRPHVVAGGSLAFPPEFSSALGERGLVVSWCPQEAVLAHAAVGGFLTHCGWNSTLESISAGKVMACWPFFLDQQMNCRYCCREWGIGMEIGAGGEVRREEVKEVVRELMGGERRNAMKKRVAEWKKAAEEAAAPGGSSSRNLDGLMTVLLKGSTAQKN